jgi:DNA ligase-1
MRFNRVADTSDELAATSARGAKVDLLAALLGQAEPDEVALLVTWLSGELTQRQIGVGWASLRDLPAASELPTLNVADVEQHLTDIGRDAGPGSQARRRALLSALFASATRAEQRFLRGLLSGDLRQGALTGIMADAVARASGVPLPLVRRAAMLRGDLPVVAAAAMSGGDAALQVFRLEIGRPIAPMLAQSASSTDDAMARLGGHAAIEWKLDGIRLQIHRRGEYVGLFTRTLDDVTSRLAEVVEAIRRLDVQTLVADGEVIALAANGRPRPFQVTASRVGRRTVGAADDTRLSVYIFDILHRDGTDLLDEPASVRGAALAELVPAEARIPRLVTADPAEARDFLTDALRHGHEGVMVKSLDSPYQAGRRGAGWLKVKPVHTLDLVVLAVEWGSGRRSGTLSNIHLGARDDTNGHFVMLGKTFKGMTDAMLQWQTERFLALASGPTDGWVVPLRPEQVVEVAFDGVQRSSRYPGGVALRFARVLQYRDDKRADEADTIDTVRAFYVE